MGKKVYPCQSCPKVFLSFQSHKEHRKEHGGPVYKCTVMGCGKVFKWRSSLASHKRSHATKKVVQPAKPLLQIPEIDIESLISSPCTSPGTGLDMSPMSPINSSADVVLDGEPSRNCAIDAVGEFGMDLSEELYLFSCDQLLSQCARELRWEI